LFHFTAAIVGPLYFVNTRSEFTTPLPPHVGHGVSRSAPVASRLLTLPVPWHVWQGRIFLPSGVSMAGSRKKWALPPGGVDPAGVEPGTA